MKKNPNMELFSDSNLKEIIENGGMLVTPEMCEKELVKRHEKEHRPFKPYENKIFIQELEGGGLILLKTDYYDGIGGMPIEKIVFKFENDSDFSETILRKYNSYIDDREIDYILDPYQETEIETWETYEQLYYRMNNVIKEYFK